ncbi:MAG: transglutaminase domain-containing protein [Pseudomonadota bacterium]
MLAWMLLAAAPWGCAVRARPVLDQPGAIPGQPDALASYREMVVENIVLINRLYQPRYEGTAYIVDTDTGSTPVQALINAEAAARYLNRYGTDRSDGSAADDVLTLVHSRFEYVDETQPWQDVAETIASGRGDCKNLSLLLLALLETAGVPAYAGISNGHMWVVSGAPENVRIMEVDTSPVRRSVYAIAAFYDMPLYRIYTTHAEKRRRREQPLP